MSETKLLKVLTTARGRVLAGACFLVAFVIGTRVVYHLPYLYSWDGVQYALSIHDFSIHKHQPHPPGNPLYSLAIWLFTFAIGEENAAMITLNVLATIAASFLIGAAAWFASEDYSESKRSWIVLGAAAFYCSNPIVWFYGCVAEIYAVEGFFVSLFLYFAIRSQKQPSYLYLASLVMGIAGGFRPSTEIFLLPAYFAIHLRPYNRKLRSVLLLIASNLAWLAPLIAMSGGVTEYFSAVINHSQRLSTEVSNSEFLTERIALVLIQSLSIPALFAVGFRLSKVRISQTEMLLMVVLLPVLLFVMFVHYPKEGYWIFIIPPLSILIPLTLSRLYSSERAVAGILAAAFLFNCYIFTKPPVYTFDEVAYEPLKRLHFEFTSPNRRTLRDYRVRMEQFMSKVSEFKPGERAIVIEKGQFPNWRVVMYYFPADLAILVMENKRLYVARGHRFEELRGKVSLDRNVKVLVIASARQPQLPGKVGSFQVYQFTYYFSRVRFLPKQFRIGGIKFTRDAALIQN